MSMRDIRTAWLILVHHLNESWKNFGDICFMHVKFPDSYQFGIKISLTFLNFTKFPDISLAFFKWNKILWLFQVSRNSRSAGHPVLNLCNLILRQIVTSIKSCHTYTYCILLTKDLSNFDNFYKIVLIFKNY